MSNAITEQEIVTVSSEGKHNSIGAAIEGAATGLRTHLARLTAEARNPIVNSVSHNSGFDGHLGYYASIVASITVSKKMFAR